MLDATTTVRHRVTVSRTIRRSIYRRVRHIVEAWGEVREWRRKIDEVRRELVCVARHQAELEHRVGGFEDDSPRRAMPLTARDELDRWRAMMLKMLEANKQRHTVLTHRLCRSHEVMHEVMHEVIRVRTKQVQAPRQRACAAPSGRPRARRSQRVVRMAKSAAGDSGDGDPEPPTARRTPTIGGAP